MCATPCLFTVNPCIMCKGESTDEQLFPCCSRECENEYFDRRAEGVYCHACHGPCLGHDMVDLMLDIDDPALVCGGEIIGHEYDYAEHCYYCGKTQCSGDCVME